MKYLIIFLSLVALSCASIPLSIKSYRPLTYSEKVLVHEILREASGRPNETYYLGRLQALLNTVEVSSEQTKTMIIGRTSEGIEKAELNTYEGFITEELSCNGYVSKEEVYESKAERHWVKIHPTWFGPYFWAVKDNYNDILIHIKIHLTGDATQIPNIIAMEDNIEKWLSVAGFSVNVEFVGVNKVDNDTFEVEINPTEWPSAYNWAGAINFQTPAHEIGHLLGLYDTYNYIDNHSTNKYLSIKKRLYLFLYEMNRNLLPDARTGLMFSQFNKISDREVCEIVVGGDKCIKVRTDKK